MFGAILKATNSSFQKGMTFCRSIYVKKVMKLVAFIFEQSSYELSNVSLALANNDGYLAKTKNAPTIKDLEAYAPSIHISDSFIDDHGRTDRQTDSYSKYSAHMYESCIGPVFIFKKS